MAICKEKDCSMRASFNYLGQKPPSYCSKHKLPEMRNIYGNSCKFENCQTEARFNYIGEKTGMFCYTHISTIQW